MATISESEYQARIRQLETLNRTLAAEVDRLRHEYDEEVAEFNAGYEAARQGLPDGAYHGLKALNAKLVEAVRAVKGHGCATCQLTLEPALAVYERELAELVKEGGDGHDNHA